MAPSCLFKLGDRVEVHNPGDALSGPYFPATVIRSPVTAKSDNIILYVEYQTLEAPMENGVPGARREVVNAVNVRPALPFNKQVFKLGDDVDVFFQKGWSRGTVVGTFEGEPRFAVRFSDSGRTIVCPLRKLRLHMEWNHERISIRKDPLGVKERVMKVKTKNPLQIKDKIRFHRHKTTKMHASMPKLLY